MATSRTVRQLIESVLWIVGAYAPGESLKSKDTSTALRVMQDLLAEWSDGGLIVPSIVQEPITLVIGQASYTVGEDGSPDLDTVRPEQIIGAWVRDSSNYDHPVGIIDERRYRLITSKTTSSRPTGIWYNATAPNGTVYAYPTPNAGESLYISSIKPFKEPTKLTEDLLNTTEIPRNYHNALKWNMVLEISPEYGKEITLIMIKRATDTLNTIISLNAARRVEPVSIEVQTAGGEGATAYGEPFSWWGD